TRPPENPLGGISEFSGPRGAHTQMTIRSPQELVMLMRTAAHQTPSRHAPMARGGIPSGPRELGGPLELMGAAMPFARNSEIYGENDPADYLYKVVSGAVRTYRVLNDGRRQIAAFHLPGDLFGLEVGVAHACSAEAIADSVVLVIKRSAVAALAE